MASLRASMFSALSAETGTMARNACRAAISPRYGSSRSRGRTRSILLTATIAGCAASAMRSSASSSSGIHFAASTTSTARSAPSSAAVAVRFIALLSARLARAWSPGVSRNAICAWGEVSTPRMRWRVVCGRGVTMLSLCPTSALRSVDLPTFGRPTSAAYPQRNRGDEAATVKRASPVRGGSRSR